MREDGAGRARVPWRSTPLVQRIIGIGARLSAAGVLVTGVTSGLAARRKEDNGEKDRGDSDGERARRRDKDGDGNRERERDRDRGRDRNDEADSDDRSERRAEREQRQRQRDRDEDSSDVESEAKKNKGKKNDDDNTNAEQNNNNNDNNNDNNNNNNNNNRNRDDEPIEDVDEDNGGGGGEGRNRAGNAGSDFFDSPLATKARRRANDFEGGREDDEEDGIFVDVDPEGESVYETDSISFATGPQGVEILTKNITYTAAPTPTPTPFPRLELPDRERLNVFDATVSVTPTAGEPVPAEPLDADVSRIEEPVSEPVEPLPEPPEDLDGGDNTMVFTS